MQLKFAKIQTHSSTIFSSRLRIFIFYRGLDFDFCKKSSFHFSLKFPRGFLWNEKKKTLAEKPLHSPFGLAPELAAMFFGIPAKWLDPIRLMRTRWWEFAHARRHNSSHMQGDTTHHTCEVITTHICKDGGGQVRYLSLPMRTATPYHWGKEPFSSCLRFEYLVIRICDWWDCCFFPSILFGTILLKWDMYRGSWVFKLHGWWVSVIRKWVWSWHGYLFFLFLFFMWY